MKMFKSTTAKSNLLVFLFFLIMTIVAFMFSGCGDDKPPIIVRDNGFDFSQDEGVSDSLVYNEWEPDGFVSDSVFFNNQLYIDSLKNLVK